MLRHWQLFAALIWGGLALLILLRGVLFEPEVIDRLPVRNWWVANAICAFFALWNMARWYQANAARREAQDRARMPLRPNPDANPGYEYIPEFDFYKIENDKKNDGAR